MDGTGDAAVDDGPAGKQEKFEERDSSPGSLPALRLTSLGALGVLVSGFNAAEVSNSESGSPLWEELGAALSEHSLLLLRGGGKLTPLQLRNLYTKLHLSLRMKYTLPDKMKRETGPELDESRNLRGECFPGFPETNVLGNARGLRDWHGLSGYLEPAAWWEKTSCQFHHDGSFSASGPPPPAIVQMYCEESPEPACGGSTLRLWSSTAEGLPYAAGATLFFSTRLSLSLADPATVERARRMTCCYRHGFGQVHESVYPLMRESCLVPQTQAPSEDSGARSITEFASLENFAFDGADQRDHWAQLYPRDENGKAMFCHKLVQRDSVGEYILVHAVCLDHLRDDACVELSWKDSMDFVEALLGPAARPPHLLALAWQPGDVAIWDNRCLQHSVPPSHRNGTGGDLGYVTLGERRLMTRTAMQPSWLPSAL